MMGNSHKLWSWFLANKAVTMALWWWWKRQGYRWGTWECMFWTLLLGWRKCWILCFLLGSYSREHRFPCHWIFDFPTLMTTLVTENICLNLTFKEKCLHNINRNVLAGRLSSGGAFLFQSTHLDCFSSILKKQKVILISLVLITHIWFLIFFQIYMKRY